MGMTTNIESKFTCLVLAYTDIRLKPTLVICSNVVVLIEVTVANPGIFHFLAGVRPKFSQFVWVVACYGNQPMFRCFPVSWEFMPTLTSAQRHGTIRHYEKKPQLNSAGASICIRSIGRCVVSESLE